MTKSAAFSSLSAGFKTGVKQECKINFPGNRRDIRNMEKTDIKKINADPVIRFGIMSLVVIAFGIYIFQKYHIDFDLLSEVISEINYVKEVTLFVSDPGIFYERLVSNGTFREIFKEPREYLVIYLVFTVCIAEYLTRFFSKISRYKEACSEKSYLLRGCIIIISFIDGFFLSFIANYLFLFLFEKVPEVPIMANQIWLLLLKGITMQIPLPDWIYSSYFVIFVLFAIIIISCAAAVGLWVLVIYIIIPTLLKYAIVAFIVMCVDISSWPKYLPILITVSLRILFGLVKKTTED